MTFLCFQNVFFIISIRNLCTKMKEKLAVLTHAIVIINNYYKIFCQLQPEVLQTTTADKLNKNNL